MLFGLRVLPLQLIELLVGVLHVVFDSLEIDLILFDDVLEVVLLPVAFFKSLLQLAHLLLKKEGLAAVTVDR